MILCIFNGILPILVYFKIQGYYMPETALAKTSNTVRGDFLKQGSGLAYFRWQINQILLMMFKNSDIRLDRLTYKVSIIKSIT